MKAKVWIPAILLVSIVFGLWYGYAYCPDQEYGVIPYKAVFSVEEGDTYENVHDLLGEPAGIEATMISLPIPLEHYWYLADGSKFMVRLRLEDNGLLAGVYRADYAVVIRNEKEWVVFGSRTEEEPAAMRYSTLYAIYNGVTIFLSATGVAILLLATGNALLILRRRRKQRNPADAASCEPQPDRTES